MADLSLDEIIATKQGINAKERPLNQNVPKQFQGKPLPQKPVKPGFQQKPVKPGFQQRPPFKPGFQQRPPFKPGFQQKPSKPGFQQRPFKPGFQQRPFQPGFAAKVNRPGGAPLKRAFSAPGPVAKLVSPNKPRGSQTPNEGAGHGGPGKGQIDARDMITIKNRIKMGDARMKILQKRMIKGGMGGQPQQPQIPPVSGAGPQVLGPGIQQQFTPQQQMGFQPPPQPLIPQGPPRFQQPNQQGVPFRQPRPLMEHQGPHPLMEQQGPRPLMEQQGPRMNQQRPPLQQQGPLLIQQQRPPFNQQQRPPFNQQQRPPFSQQQGVPFSQQQLPPFNQQFSQQAPEFNQQSPDFNQQPPDFIQQPPDFIQQPPDFDQQPPDFIQEQFSQLPPQFGQEQAPPFSQEQPLQFNPDPQFAQQSALFNPQGPPEQPQQFSQQGPGPQFAQQAPQFSQPPPQMNQPPLNFMQSPPGPNHPPNFNQPPPNQGFNPPPADLSQPPPEFIQPPSDMSQPPPGFGQLPPDFSGPPPGFQPVADEEGDDMGFMSADPVEKTVVEDTGTSLKITRTIPEVSFDGENLTVTRRLPATGRNQETQRPFSDRALGPVHLNAAKPAPAPQPPKRKFQPTPIKAPSPPRNTVKTGGPTLSTNRPIASSAGQVPVSTRSPIQPLMQLEPGTPVPSSSVQTVSNTSIMTAKPETALSSGPITRTLNIAPQQPSRLKPPPQTSTRVAAPSERPSALSRIQLPNQNTGLSRIQPLNPNTGSSRIQPPNLNTGSVFSRIQQQQSQSTRSALSRVQHPAQSSSVLSRLSAAPVVSVTKRLAPLPAAPPQPARMHEVSPGARMAVKRPAMSLSERFSSGGSGNPIPVITDHGPIKKRRSTEPEPEKADFGTDFSMEGQSSQEETGVPLLSPLQGFRILVSNLHSTVTQDDVIELFGALGPLKRANTLTNGQAEVAFIHKEHALLALKTYHNRELDGQPMFLKLTTPLNAKVMQPPAGEDSPPVTLPVALRAKKPPAPSSAPVEIPLIHKALFKTSDGAVPSKAVRFTVKL